MICYSQVVRQSFYEPVSSDLRGSGTCSCRRTSRYQPTFAIQDVFAILDIRFFPLCHDVSSARRCYILRGSAQRFVRFSRLRLHCPRMRANRIAASSFVGDFQRWKFWHGTVSNLCLERQTRDDRRVCETSSAGARDRAQNTVVVFVDCDDFIYFQHDHPVHQYFPNVQGCVQRTEFLRFHSFT